MRRKTENSKIQVAQSMKVPRGSIQLSLNGVKKIILKEVHSDGISYGK